MRKKWVKPKEGWSFTYEQYRFLLDLPFETKVAWATELLVDELGRAKRPNLACSWGKASVAMLHIAKELCSRILVVYHNTGVYFPEVLKYRDRLLEEWDITRYVETTPIKTFWECVKEYGLPTFRAHYKQRKDRHKGSPKCCYYMKEKPAKDHIRRHDIDLELLGLQAPESMVRRLSFLREGWVFDSQMYRTRICRPLMIWTDADVWQYHKVHEIPYNPLYDKMDRTGCMPCTGFKNWRKVLAKANPKMYRIISKIDGQRLLEDWECTTAS